MSESWQPPLPPLPPPQQETDRQSPSSTPSSAPSSPLVNMQDEHSAMLSPSSAPVPSTSASTLDTPFFPTALLPHPHPFPHSPLPLPHPPPPPSTGTPTSRSLPAQFVSSPLNPSSPFSRSTSQSRAGSMYINRLASEETYALSTPFSSLSPSQRGSMVLYRLATTKDDGVLLPPPVPGNMLQRDSLVSSSGDSIVSLSSDSKYPQGSFQRGNGGFVPYAFDPALDDEKESPDEVDPLHDIGDSKGDDRGPLFAMRGVLNVGVLVILITGLLSLFIFYPVLTSLRRNARNKAIDGNTRINATGQASVLLSRRNLIDPDTPQDAHTRTGFDSERYTLVFSDEFNEDGRTFYPGDDPFWEAADLWYGVTADQEWYDPGQVTTKDGKLRIVLENVESHALPFRSGMLQSWNKFCFTSGYIEVSLSLPGPGENAQGYWPGVWTMGNLARPGYRATTDGTWPYTYNQCDLGTFPNQTLQDKSGPPAALHSDFSRQRYNFELSWLPGQKLSACTCPGEPHPGPTNSKGRGAPEIDILEAEKNKLGPGQVVSQSAQFAPFTHDYLYGNETPDQYTVYDPANTVPNTYRGSAVQQAVSSLTRVPSNGFQGTGQFVNYGFEYWANPAQPDEGFITWQVDNKPTARLGAAAVGPDQGPGGSGVSQRLIPEEPMSIVLNLGVSANWQNVDLTTLQFPAVMQVDYVRVYQREGHTNVGCSPAAYPTAEYISQHQDAYTNPNLTKWNYPWPKNGLYAGGC